MNQAVGQTIIEQAPLSPVIPKSKTPAILLAVFLGFWTWVYTYKVDAWKFWVNLGLSIVTLSLWFLVAWVWAIVDAVRRPDEWYQSFPNGDTVNRIRAVERAREMNQGVVQAVPATQETPMEATGRSATIDPGENG